MSSKKIIFSNSYFPRTGHNFASEALKVFTNHKVLAHNRSETRLSNLLEKYYNIYYGISHETDRLFFDKIVLSDIRKNILSEAEGEYLMIKNTSFDGVYALPKVFPNDVHIIVLRHPEDVFTSIFKAMDFRKKGYKNRIKKLTTYFGLYPYYFCRKASKKIISKVPELNNFFVIRYEDLVTQNEGLLIELKEKFNCDKTLDQIKEELNSIEVINTSFFEEINSKNIWEAKAKTEKFKPIKRRHNSIIIRKAIQLGSKKLVNKLKY